jgi:hypothetical protein
MGMFDPSPPRDATSRISASCTSWTYVPVSALMSRIRAASSFPRLIAACRPCSTFVFATRSRLSTQYAAVVVPCHFAIHGFESVPPMIVDTRSSSSPVRG